MTLLEQWEQRKRQIHEALADCRINADVAAREIAHLEYRINRRPLILKRRKDRKAYRIVEALQHRAARLAGES